MWLSETKLYKNAPYYISTNNSTIVFTWTDFKTPSGQILRLLPQTIQRGKRNCEHSRGRCCLWQWCTEHKVVGQQTQGNTCPREAQGRDLKWALLAQRAKRILKDLPSEKFVKYLSLIMDVTKVPSTLSKTFQRAELCITTILTRLGTGTLRTIQTSERTLVQEAQRRQLWRNRYSSRGATELLQGLW